MECGVQSTRAPQPWTKHYRVTIIAEWITAKRKRQMSSFSLGLLCVWGSRTHYYLYFQQKQSRAQTRQLQMWLFFFFFYIPQTHLWILSASPTKKKVKKKHRSRSRPPTRTREPVRMTTFSVSSERVFIFYSMVNIKLFSILNSNLLSTL